MKIVKTTTIRAVVTKMSAASTTSLVARIQNRMILIWIRYDCISLLAPPRWWQGFIEEELPIDHLDEGESNTSTKPPVGHDELLLQVDLLQTEPRGNYQTTEGQVAPPVGNECEDIDSNEADEKAENDRPQDEPNVPAIRADLL